MSDEIKVAAERLFKWAQRHSADNVTAQVRAAIADCYSVAQAYLAEHDETPITEDFFRALGFAWSDDMAAFGGCISSRQNLWLRVNGQWWVTCASTYGGRFCSHRRLKTCGDVRRLCAALGIKLTEPGAS